MSESISTTTTSSGSSIAKRGSCCGSPHRSSWGSRDGPGCWSESRRSCGCRRSSGSRRQNKDGRGQTSRSNVDLGLKSRAEAGNGSLTGTLCVSETKDGGKIDKEETKSAQVSQNPSTIESRRTPFPSLFISNINQPERQPNSTASRACSTRRSLQHSWPFSRVCFPTRLGPLPRHLGQRSMTLR